MWGNCRKIRNLNPGFGGGGHIKDPRGGASRPYRPRQFNIHESFLPFYRPLSANIRRLNTHVIIIIRYNRHKKLQPPGTILHVCIWRTILHTYKCVYTWISTYKIFNILRIYFVWNKFRKESVQKKKTNLTTDIWR